MTAAIDQIVREKGWTVTAVISECSKGVAQAAQTWAEARGIEVIRRPILWAKHGMDAHQLRNKEVYELADKAIFITDGKEHNLTLPTWEAGIKEYVTWTPGTSS